MEMTHNRVVFKIATMMNFQDVDWETVVRIASISVDILYVECLGNTSVIFLRENWLRRAARNMVVYRDISVGVMVKDSWNIPFVGVPVIYKWRSIVIDTSEADAVYKNLYAIKADIQQNDTSLKSNVVDA